MEKKIYDNDLGTILLRTTPRATRYTLKISKGMITATMPEGGDKGRMLSFIEENRQKLLAALKKHPARPLLNEATALQATTFRVEIFRTDRNNYYMTLKEGILRIACPSGTRFESDRVQEILKDLLEKALRHEAKRLLPDRLMALAARHRFTCTGVRIMNSKTRWGSCSTRKSINLSLSLMLLPWHLVDYVLLHELCHTVEMNHSDRFWKLLNSVTDNKALALRHELKGYHML
ncbi:M48 family metallopeptidase [Parabacteroides faecis]|uniref:M48 family metallopeptidase n=1 Tax=Parabacteroides faecis TaxID=1217282 RepID=UPI0021642955|nr:SprT family zinc-dependent metalloprotease [Parabacteroides faecis]MCS2890113.1 M48 family metallopeptidase [Parabacteroides faecis]UVQ46191.1 M48 family metallopeptidase [Parabacteroides faecis]